MIVYTRQAVFALLTAVLVSGVAIQTEMGSTVPAHGRQVVKVKTRFIVMLGQPHDAKTFY